jgi:hypothetical protein
MKALVTVYLIIAILSAVWFDAMDRRYGVGEAALPAAFGSSLLMGAIWPVMLPLGLIMSATGWGGRWTIKPAFTGRAALENQP